MILREKHPCFDLEMELACLLTARVPIPLVAVRDDLRLKSLAATYILVERLKRRGYKVRICNINGLPLPTRKGLGSYIDGRAVGLKAPLVGSQRQEVEDYFRTVYPNLCPNRH